MADNSHPVPRHGPKKQRRHRGEADAIELAKEIHADALLADEEKARAQAVSVGLLVIGTVGLLERAADTGLITNLVAVHDQLRLTDFHVSDNILRASLERHLGRKSP